MVEQSLFSQLTDDKYRFANNNKDLELASKWLKKEFEYRQHEQPRWKTSGLTK